jgi:hypothetical protein
VTATAFDMFVASESRTLIRGGSTMGLIDQALGLFGRGREHRFQQRMQQASALSHAGEKAEARALYEGLAGEATELYGADAELTLITRGCVADTYEDEAPERAVRLLEQIVRDGEGLYGPVDDGRLVPRLDLALRYRQVGEYAKCHELSEEILADCDRLLGPEHPRTVNARYLVEESAGDLARSELAAFLDIPRDSFAEESAPVDWQERLSAAATRIEAARSHRARMLWDSTPSNDASGEGLHFEYDFEHVRPDRFHLVRGAFKEGGWPGLEPGWGEFDEWIVIGDEHYRQPLWWLVDNDETKEEHEREDRKLLADSHFDLLRGQAPTAVNVRRGDHAAYLVAEYAAVTQAWTDVVDSPSSLREARTSLWIDLSHGHLRRAEGRFVLPLPPEDGGVAIESFKHGFASYDEDIAIEAPDLEVEPDEVE